MTSSPASPPFRSVKEHLVHIARLQKGMQLAIMVRCKPRSSLVSDVTPSDWQLLLAEFDASVQAMRTAYRALLNTEPAVHQAIADWRARRTLAANQGTALSLSDPQVLMVLIPAVEAARGQTDELIQRALKQWEEVTRKYLLMLQGQRPVAAQRAA